MSRADRVAFSCRHDSILELSTGQPGPSMDTLRVVSAGLALLACLLAPGPAAAQDQQPPHPFANRNVRLVVAFGAGGTSDVLARVLGQKLGERWGQTVVIENRAGAGGNL